jgi:aspartyl-tRNA(Asn)/glutamyl-tRNA(Gln) amidotransferase subunit A
VVATIAGAARALRERSASSEELVHDAFARADAYDDRLGVYLNRFDDSALAAARTADDELARGIDRGPLHGIPIGVKDTIMTAEGPTTSNSLVDYPAWRERRDAPVVAALRAAGAVVMGKVTAMEFAIGVPDADKPFPTPRNPWNPACYPGGSSTGSGSGIRAGMFLGALGTDTAGSIRIPAAYCGITGHKGTYGTVSNAGVMPLGPSLDVVGPMTRTAADAALMLPAMAGFHATDPVSSDRPIRDLGEPLDASLKGLRIGVERRNHLGGDLVDPQMPPVFDAAVAEFERAGAVVSEVEIPYYREITDSVLLTMFTEGLAHHHRALREQWERFGRSARAAFAGATVFSAYEYVAAQKVRRLGRRLLSELFEDVDLIVCPTTATAAPQIEGLDLGRIIATLFTNLWSGTGNPTISVPMGFGDHGLPFGLQIAGRPFEDWLVLGAAHAYQQRTDWHTRTPPLVAAGERERSGDRHA